MTFNAQEAGQRIRNRRTELNIPIAKAAFDLHISIEYLRKVELGHKSPSLETLLSLSEYLDVSTDYLSRGHTTRSDLSEKIDSVITALVAIQKEL